MRRLQLAALAAFICIAPSFANAAESKTPAAQLMSKLTWRSIGPYIGGRVVAVAGVPSNPDLFYMGGVQGGIWKSTDYGQSWTNITDGKIPGVAEPDRRARGRAVEPAASSTPARREPTSAATSTPATASTRRPTPARRGRTPACARRT